LPAPSHLASLTRIVVISAIVVTGMYLAASLVNPILFAFVISVIATPAVRWLERRGLQHLVAVLAVVGIIAVASVALIAFLGISIIQLDEALPAYQELLREHLALLEELGLEIGDLLPKADGEPSVIPSIETVIEGLTELVIDFLVTFIVTIFMLQEISGLQQKLRYLPGFDRAELEGRCTTFCRSLNGYVAIRTRGSLVTGAVVALLLWVMGIDTPALWAILIVLFSYIPFIGLPIASIPPIGLAWLQHGLPGALVVTVGIAGTDFVARRVFSPHPARWELEISPLVIVLSVFFWPLVLGVPGLFLAVPLMLFAKAVLGAHEETRWLAVLMEPPNNQGGGGKRTE
jgi:AI-2 transport protein TqsA